MSRIDHRERHGRSVRGLTVPSRSVARCGTNAVKGALGQSDGRAVHGKHYGAPVPADRIQRRWSGAEIEAYRKWIRQSAAGYGATVGKIDCADWVLSVLIEYARLRNLPLRLRMGMFSGVFIFDWIARAYYHTETWWHYHDEDYKKLERRIRKRLGAADLADVDVGNTKAITKHSELQSGDLISGAAHVQLVLNNNVEIVPSGTSSAIRVIEILQGNLPAVEVEHKAWNLDGNGLYVKKNEAWDLDKNRTFSDEWDAGQWQGRQWNFAEFDDVL